ncbi:hypothetical protein HanPSC8_Chr12g0515011 [Helianthus annuus]|uniref:Uncharacterized protein n=1 Tax=Helianthus annuus TaxID=4232 RepID=A0A251TB57_HELAN|nr:hypothetical protein HanPSC8_Chr12g0515011 [Helianthus annuus]
MTDDDADGGGWGGRRWRTVLPASETHGNSGVILVDFGFGSRVGSVVNVGFRVRFGFATQFGVQVKVWFNSVKPESTRVNNWSNVSFGCYGFWSVVRVNYSQLVSQGSVAVRVAKF